MTAEKDSDFLTDESDCDSDSDTESSPTSTTTELDFPLYQGSSITVRSAIEGYIKIFVDKSCTKETLSEMLNHSKDILPQPNNLPASYKRLRSLISNELIPVILYNVCINDCLIFRKEHGQDNHCKICGEPRYKKDYLGRKVCRRYYSYCSIKSALELLFSCCNIAQILQEHTSSALGVLTDIKDTAKWQHWMQGEGMDSSKIIMGLNTDGMNPFHSQGSNYSCWPIILTILNLPKKIRNKADALILVGVVPSKNPRLGNGLEPNLDIYVDILVDELLQLAHTDMFSAYSKAPISVKVKLLMFIMDFQGYAKFFSMSGVQSYMNCNVCMMKATRKFNKMVLLGHDRYSEVQQRNYETEVKIITYSYLALAVS